MQGLLDVLFYPVLPHSISHLKNLIKSHYTVLPPTVQKVLQKPLVRDIRFSDDGLLGLLCGKSITFEKEIEY